MGGTVLLEVPEVGDLDTVAADVVRRLEGLGERRVGDRILGVMRRDAPSVSRLIEDHGGTCLRLEANAPWVELLKHCETGAIAVVPSGARVTGAPPWWLLDLEGHPVLGVWGPAITAPMATATPGGDSAAAWLLSRSAFHKLCELGYGGEVEGRPGISDIGKMLRAGGVDFRWRAAPLVGPAPEPAEAKAPLALNARVLALIPHRECEAWLAEALQSLVHQTRPLDAIVVIDDGSAEPPVDIVGRFSDVTLLHAEESVGPYRLVQTVVDRVNYDAFLFQDADDWSACDRLERLLAEAARTGAELVGTQEIRVVADEGDAFLPVAYPFDVNAAFETAPGHPLLHPTSLIAAGLLKRLGGFATAFRFSADSELLLRAAFVSRIVNIFQFGYFRRRRRDSLTTNPATGLSSPARRELTERIKARALGNLGKMQRGEPLDLTPLKTASPVVLRHLCGPGIG